MRSPSHMPGRQLLGPMGIGQHRPAASRQGRQPVWVALARAVSVSVSVPVRAVQVLVRAARAWVQGQVQGQRQFWCSRPPYRG